MYTCPPPPRSWTGSGGVSGRTIAKPLYYCVDVFCVWLLLVIYCLSFVEQVGCFVVCFVCAGSSHSLGDQWAP